MLAGDAGQAVWWQNTSHRREALNSCTGISQANQKLCFGLGGQWDCELCQEYQNDIVIYAW